MKLIAIIPARAGSKGIPRKNLKLLGEKPLIQYTVEAALKVFESKDIIVSTDDNEIKVLCENLGLKVPFLRPSSLATDTAGTQEVLLHAIDFLEKNGEFPDGICLLQPTSPFRKSQHVLEAIDIFKENPEIDMVVSVKETEANPYYVLFEENLEGFLKKSKKGNFTRRQDVPKVWEINGAIYVIKVSSIKKKSISEFENVKKYSMEKKPSLDIDDLFDWKLAEQFLSDLD